MNASQRTTGAQPTMRLLRFPTPVPTPDDPSVKAIASSARLLLAAGNAAGLQMIIRIANHMLQRHIDRGEISAPRGWKRVPELKV